MANWKKVLVSGSSIEVRNITASNLPESTAGSDKIVVIDTTTGRLAYTSSAAGGGGIFEERGTSQTTNNSLKISGSTLQPAPTEDYDETRASSYANDNYALIVSESVYFNNHNVGHPNSLAWGSNLNGSIFDAYNSTTDVSEILRTIVGLISASHSDLVATPTPNSNTFSGANVEPDADKPSTQVSTTFNSAYIPTSYNNSIIEYFNTKGFNAGAGDTVLGNIGVTKYKQTNDNFGIRLDSLPGPGTAFDAGLKDTEFTVFAIASQSFQDNRAGSDPTPDETSTFTTASFFQSTQTGAGTTNGITVATIATGNPTVIPPVYQEAEFTNFPLITDRRYAASGESFTNISSSGYYRYHDIKVGIATGSTDIVDIIGGALTTATNTNGATSTYFITPLDTSDFSANTISIEPGTIEIDTVQTRSLSGVPYIRNITAKIHNFTASGMFDPLFWGGSSIIAEMSFTDSIGTTINRFADTQFRAKAEGGTLDTGYVGAVWDTTGTTERGIGDTPTITDKFIVDYVQSSNLATIQFGRGYTGTNYISNELEGGTPTNSTFSSTLTVRRWNNTTTSSISTTPYHTAGEFGQPAASGAMSVFYSNDGEDTAPGSQASTTSIEYFGGEGFRRLIEDTTDLASSNVWDSGSRLTLGNGGDLQVKPGYLVNPEASGHGYWYPTDSYSSTDYKWYLREFDTNEAGTALNLVLTFNSITDFVPLSTTTANKIGIGVLLEYQLNNLGGGNPYIYDVVEGTDGANGDVSLGQTTSNQYNPFGDTVDVVSGWGSAGDNGSTQITLGLSAGQKQVINSTYSKVYLLVRYTGDPSNNLENIQVSTT